MDESDDRSPDHQDDHGHDHRHDPVQPPLWQAEPMFVPERNPAVATVAVDGQLLLTHARAPSVLRFDPISAFLWNSLAPGVTVAELAEDVAYALDLAADEALESLAAVVTTLGRTGYLTEPSDAPILRVPSFPTVPPDT